MMITKLKNARDVERNLGQEKIEYAFVALIVTVNIKNVTAIRVTQENVRDVGTNIILNMFINDIVQEGVAMIGIANIKEQTTKRRCKQI